jgi:general secretion pathway protein I
MRDDAGFTLLEVVIAFAVAALALGALYEGSTAGIRATAIANHYEAALSRARSRLAAAGNPALLNAGESSGDDGGGYTWRLLVSRVASAPIAGAPPETARTGPLAAIYAVRVTIAWRLDGGERQVTLATTRFAMTGAAAP